MTMSNGLRLRTGKNASSTHFTVKQRRAFRPRLEALEDRLAPATISICDATATEGLDAARIVDVPISSASSPVSNPKNIVRGPSGDYFITNAGTNTVLRYDGTTFQYKGVFVSSGSGGLSEAIDLVFANGDLFVSSGGSNAVLRYDGATGSFKGAFVPNGANGIRRPTELLVHNGALYISGRDSHDIQRYDLATGAFIDKFVAPFAGGLTYPVSQAFGPDGNFYVSDRGGSLSILRYNGTTGAFIDTFVPQNSGGMTLPAGIKFGPDGNLYVASFDLNGVGAVHRFDGTTGAPMDVFIPPGFGGIKDAVRLLFNSNQALVASGQLNGFVRYDVPSWTVFNVTLSSTETAPVTVQYSTAPETARSGNDFTSASGTLTFAPGETSKTILVKAIDDSILEPVETFVVNLSAPSGATIADGQGVGTIMDNDGVPDPSGPTISISDAVPVVEGPALLNTLDPSGAATVGLNGPRNIAFNDIVGHVHYGDLFVTSYVTHSVLRFDWETQAYYPFVTPNSGGLGEPFAAVFGPDGNLYVTALDQDTVLRYDGTDGHFLDVFVTSGSGGLKNASGLTFGSDGNLYVCSSQSDQVLRYQGPNGSQPGQFIGVFANTGIGSVPDELVFGPDGNLYVSCPQFDTPTPFDGVINRYQGLGGASPGQFIDAFVPTGSGGQTVGRSPVFDAQGRLYITDAELNAVLRYQGPNEPSPGTFIDAHITSAAGGLDTPIGLAIGRDGAVFVADRDLDKVASFHTPQARFVVTLDSVSATEISVAYTTSSVSALAGSDFVSTSGTLTFKPGETSKTILVKTIDDSALEPVETFVVNLSNPVGATIADGQATGTITDNDPKFYVVNDAASDQVYRYGPTGTSQATTALGAGNTAPRGAASNVAGDRLWVADANKTVSIYNPAGTLLGSWTAGSLASNAQVEGIATNGTDIWIVDARQDKVFKYTGAASVLSGSQNAASSFNLASGNNNPKGIVTDGTSIWVVNDAGTDKVYKYTMAGALLGSWTITGGGGAPTGITLDPSGPTQLWIVDSATDRVYEFAGAMSRVSGSQAASASFALAAGNTNPQDIADPPGVSSSAAATTTTLASNSPNPASPRKPLTFTATVIGGANGELVELHDNTNDGAVVATGVLTGGSATLTIPANTFAEGTYELVAVYPGGGAIAPSVSDPILQVIDARPSIVSIAPFSGPTTGGAIVVITGSNFEGATAVAFGPNSATSFTVNSPTQITATAPAVAGVGAVDVVVTTPDGSSTTTGTADDFTYVWPAPNFHSMIANGGEM